MPTRKNDTGTINISVEEQGEKVMLIYLMMAGMTPEVRGRIFDPFFTTNREKGQWSGNEYYLQFGHPENGGNYRVHSEPKGSTFRMTFSKELVEKGPPLINDLFLVGTMLKRI